MEEHLAKQHKYNSFFIIKYNYFLYNQFIAKLLFLFINFQILDKIAKFQIIYFFKFKLLLEHFIFI